VLNPSEEALQTTSSRERRNRLDRCGLPALLSKNTRIYRLTRIDQLPVSTSFQDTMNERKIMLLYGH